MEDHGECMLVMIGATPEGKKELLGFQVGVRESAQSWHELLIDLKSRGLKIAPELAVADGALGFWKALDEVFPGNTASAVLGSQKRERAQQGGELMQADVKKDLREIWMAPIQVRRRWRSISSRRSTEPSTPGPSSA